MLCTRSHKGKQTVHPQIRRYRHAIRVEHFLLVPQDVCFAEECRGVGFGRRGVEAMSLRLPSAMTSSPLSLAACTVSSNAVMPADPYCSKNASWGFTAGTRPVTLSSTSSWKSRMMERTTSFVGRPRPDLMNAGIWSMRGSRPTTHGFPALRMDATSRSENSCMGHTAARETMARGANQPQYTSLALGIRLRHGNHAAQLRR